MSGSIRLGSSAGAMLAAIMVLGMPGVASGAPVLTSATIDGVTSTSAPAGSVMDARVTGRAVGGPWAGTEYRFGSGSSDCVNTTDVSSGNVGTVSFDVTAPRNPGSYSAGFIGTSTSTCGGNKSPELVVNDALRVTTPGANPNLPPRCGINVMLVLDKSGSIQSSGQTETVRNATRAFLNALAGTGASVSITDFSSTAKQQVPYTTVTAETITGTFESYLTNVYKPSGYTNWQAAFSAVKEANATQPLADLVVFITDGDPTARTNANGTVTTGLTEGDVSAMRPAADEADRVKTQGSHVFALGVGAAVTKPASASRLTAVSGPDEYPAVAFSNADFTLVQDFADLAARLRQIVLELCQSSVTVTKLVDEGDGFYHADANWEFTASVSMSAGTSTWLKPAPPPATGSRSAFTKTDGTATFQWKPTNSSASGTVTLTETAKPGFVFVDAVCSTSTPTRSGQHRRTVTTTTGIPSVTVGPGQYATCIVHNRILSGTIEIEKAANPHGTTPFPFTGSLGDFSLVDDGTATASRVFTDVVPGTYTVSELVPGNWTLAGIACDGNSTVVAVPAVAITLPAGGAVVCTFSDVQVIPPSPPNPDPEPPPVPVAPTPVVPSPPTPPTGAPSTRLRLIKLAPRVARIGRRVTVRLRVTNIGTVAATGVALGDSPSAAIALSRVQATGSPRISRGAAIWQLGTLAPGASRTVRVTALIESGTPGLKRNIAAALADNAEVASAATNTRLLRPSIPRVTG